MRSVPAAYTPDALLTRRERGPISRPSTASASPASRHPHRKRGRWCHVRCASPLPRGLLRAARGVAGAVGVGAGAGQLAAVDDQVLVRDRAVVEPALEDLAGAGGVAG